MNVKHHIIRDAIDGEVDDVEHVSLEEGQTDTEETRCEDVR